MVQININILSIILPVIWHYLLTIIALKKIDFEVQPEYNPKVKNKRPNISKGVFTCLRYMFSSIYAFSLSNYNIFKTYYLSCIGA